MSDNKSTPEPSMDEILASIRRILAEDAGSPPPQHAAPAGEVFDLTEAIADDGTVRHIEPVAMRLAAGTDVPPLPDGRVEPAVSPPGKPADGPRIVSDAASKAAAASFARLADASREGHRDGERDLERLAEELLRPMLQAWLDEHLPALVERLVRAEIARVAGQGPAAP